eukprot:scaffold10310_cov171-Amphora_coffeaeformis.AAC.5
MIGFLLGKCTITTAGSLRRTSHLTNSPIRDEGGRGEGDEGNQEIIFLANDTTEEISIPDDAVNLIPFESLQPKDSGATPVWLNYALARMWFLFQKNTKRLVAETIQPNLDVDAVAWACFGLAPYEPFCTSVQFSFLEPPAVAFEMNVAGFLPITRFPVLRTFFFRLITQEIPKRFIYPNKINQGITPEPIRVEQNRLVEQASSEGEHLPNEDVPEKVLREVYPEQWALFDTLDLDGSGCLSGVELSLGLEDWGYTAEDSSETFDKLDANMDKKISFREFVYVWPDLAKSFVPSRYRGALTVFLRRGQNLAEPETSHSSRLLPGERIPIPMLVFNLANKMCRAKTTPEHLAPGGPDTPVWMQAFELNCRNIAQDELQIEVIDGNKRAFLGVYDEAILERPSMPLQVLTNQPNKQNIEVKLDPKGSLVLDLFYSDFVDAVA